MKRIFILLLFLCVQNSYPADSSGGGGRLDLNAIRDFPYLQLILEPTNYLNNQRYLRAEKEDRVDLINYAREIRASQLDLLQFLYHALIAISQMNEPDVQKVVDYLNDNSFLSDGQIKQALAMAQKYLKQGTIQDAFRWLSADALKSRLHQLADGTILDVFFTPLDMRFEHTRLEDTLIWLIRSEQEAIRVASYFFRNEVIAHNLHEAMMRGVRVEVIVDKDNYRTGRETVLDEFGIPYKIWQHPSAAKENLKMHQKFMLFERNIDNQSFVAMGSYNITEMANRQHENMLITNDPYIYDRFARRFTFIEFFAREPEYQSPASSSSASQATYSSESNTIGNPAAQLLIDALQTQLDTLAFIEAEPSESKKRKRMVRSDAQWF